MEFKKVTPATLFFENDKEMIRAVCTFLKAESEKRVLKSAELRGKNICRFQKNFRVGDIVKFNMKSYIGFGKVQSKNGNKMYELERIDGSGTVHVHASQLEIVLISEHFLRKLLCV